MNAPYINIHTHRPAGRGIELRTKGIHPWEAERAAFDSESLPADIQAIGEIGLDFACGVSHAAQLATFRDQLDTARKAGLPVVLHCVKAFEPVLKELALRPPRTVVFHGFIGSPEQARRAIACGYYLSFGERTFASPRTLVALRNTPLDRIFVETDDSPTPIETVYARIAEALGIAEPTLRQALLLNYKRIFENG